MQSNSYHEDWHSFYFYERLSPLFKQAYDESSFTSSDLKSFNALYGAIKRYLPTEKPRLIHGDLWSGNYMTALPSQPVLIDPCVSYGHREMDLAMALLFGGFNEEFYHQYSNCMPLEKGWKERMDLYQLYYLLVHVIMFKGGYVSTARNIIKKYI